MAFYKKNVTMNLRNECCCKELVRLLIGMEVFEVSL